MKHLKLNLIIFLIVIYSNHANANQAVTSMTFGDLYAIEGSINDDGTFGEVNSVDPFFGQHWFATQATTVITNSNGVTFNGFSDFGYFNYAADISLMTDNQVAVGLYWNWSTATAHPFLAVLDCVTTLGLCVGQTTGQDGVQFGGFQTGPFPGMTPTFSGTGSLSTVPVPAAIWLFGSGLLGLMSIARRKNNV